MADAFEDFESDDLNNVVVKSNRTQTRFPCSECNGTGRYLGRRTVQEKAHCFACKGKGYFLTDEYTRAKARAKARATAAETRAAVWNEFKANNADVLEYLEKAASFGNEFQASLLEQLRRGKPLSEKQFGLAKMKADAWNEKRRAAAAAREAEAKNAPQIDLNRIREMFDAARANGHKRPKYRAEGVSISAAPMTGRNPGALYIKDIETDEYLGKLVGTEFKGNAKALTALQTIAANPLEAAVRYGQKTGRCACCGRELTNKLSVELGIGPICRGEWGL